eukprot:3096786-Rhodomonas_salina.1
MSIAGQLFSIAAARGAALLNGGEVLSCLQLLAAQLKANWTWVFEATASFYSDIMVRRSWLGLSKLSCCAFVLKMLHKSGLTDSCSRRITGCFWAIASDARK